jgi:hypothetical protein
MARSFHKPGNVENRLGYYLGQIARSAFARRGSWLLGVEGRTRSKPGLRTCFERL